VRVPFVRVVLKGKLGCDLLVLLGACVSLGLSLFCCVTGDVFSPVVSLSGVGLFRRFFGYCVCFVVDGLGILLCA